MSHSQLSPETVNRIESWLDPLEIYACIFLLYDNVDTALECICHEILTCNRYLPVLDSVLFKEPVSYEGPLMKWSRYAAGKDAYWQDKLMETLLIIKDFWIVEKCTGRKRDLELKFLPNQVNTSCCVDLVRKALYLMVEDLSKDEWNKLRDLIIKETKLRVKAMFTEVPECLLFTLMSKNIIQTKKKGQRVNLSLLVSWLKRLEMYYWSEQLKNIEYAVNREAGFSVENDASSRFNLDPEDPGTILIFNVVDYDNKMVNGVPLTKREGSHVDEQRLLSTFDLLGFKSVRFQNPKSEDIIPKIRKYLEKFCLKAKASKKERCFAISILAHGDKEGFYCTNGNLVAWDSIRAELRHPYTNGLARLLLIQACKGHSQVTKSEESKYVERDGIGSDSNSDAKNLKDLFELASSVSGFAAYRSTEHGSFFLKSFCEHILQSGSECDLHQITALINIDFDLTDVYCKDSDTPVSMTAELIVTPKKLLYLGVPQKQREKVAALVNQWKNTEKNECKPRDQQCQTVYLQPYLGLKTEPLEAKSNIANSKQKGDEDSKEEGEEEHKETSILNHDELKKEALKLGEVKKK